MRKRACPTRIRTCGCAALCSCLQPGSSHLRLLRWGVIADVSRYPLSAITSSYGLVPDGKRKSMQPMADECRVDLGRPYPAPSKNFRSCRASARTGGAGSMVSM